MGAWTLLATSFLFLISLLLMLAGLSLTFSKCLMTVSAAAFIGCATNSVAITMLFEKWPSDKYALPYTGIVPLNRQRIIDALARTVDRNLLSPDVIRRELERRDLFVKVRSFAAEKIATLLDDKDFVEKLADRVVQGLSAAVRSDEFYAFIRAEVVKRVGVLGRIGDMTGLVDYDRLTCAICDELVAAAGKLKEDPDKWRIPLRRQVASLDGLDGATVAGWLGSQDSLIDSILAEIKPENMVREKLAAYSAEQVRDLIRNQTRRHLGWLELWGGMLGGIGGAVLFFLDHLFFGNP